MVNHRIYTTFLYSLMQYYVDPKLDKMTAQYFGPNKPSTHELGRKTVLALVNTNPVLDYLIPLPENVIPVAGVQIKDPKPLPKV